MFDVPRLSNLHRLCHGAAINCRHVIGQTMAGRSRAPVLRGAAFLLLSRPDDGRLAAKGRAGRVPAAGRFWPGAAGHAGFSGGGLAAYFIFFCGNIRLAGATPSAGAGRICRDPCCSPLAALVVSPARCVWLLQTFSCGRAGTNSACRLKTSSPWRLLAGRKSLWLRGFILDFRRCASRRWPRNSFFGACCIRSSNSLAGRGSPCSASASSFAADSC